MAHYAFINNEGIVVDVITGRDEDKPINGITDWEAYYGAMRDGLICKRTSYHTYYDENGVSCHANGGIPFRGKYACIGDVYDAVNDVFVAPPVEEDATE